MILVSNTDIKFKYPEKTGVCVCGYKILLSVNMVTSYLIVILDDYESIYCNVYLQAEEEITVTWTNAEISDQIKPKYRLTRTFGKLSYFLQCLGGSSYRELTEKTLNERTRWNKPFFQVGLWE